MRRGAAGLLSLFAASCGGEDRPSQDLTDSADPVYRVDLSRCPRTPEWPNLQLPGGGLADVSIVALGDTRLYIPMAWLRESGWRAVPRAPSTGMIARIGGAGRAEPPLDANFTNHGGAAQPNCPGVVHVVGPQPPRTPRIDPDFSLTLFFDRSSMGPPLNDHSRQLPQVYRHNSVDLHFSHDRRAGSFDLVQAHTQPLPPQRDRRVEGTQHIYGVDTDGWTETGQSRGSSFSLVNRRGDALNPVFTGVNTLGVIDFPFWATGTIALTYHVPERHVPPDRWASFRQPLRELLSWLSTPPRERDNDRRFSLAF